MMKIVTKGMTLSGVSTQTTGGNTMREIVKFLVMKQALGLTDKDINVLVAGDDVVTIFSK